MRDADDSDSRALRYMLGDITISRETHEATARHGPSVVTLLERHARNDFGDVDATLRRQNELAILNSGNVESRYRLMDGTVIVIATNAGRTSTTVDVAASASMPVS